MNQRLRNTFGLALTITTLFISYATALPAQAQAALTRGDVVALANTDRAQSGVAGNLAEDARLDAAAQAVANDMAAKGYFSHVAPGGTTPWYWLKRAGYYYWSAGQNLAVNFDDAQSLNSAWMNSPTHRANIVNAGYSRIGIGIAHGTYHGKPATFIVEYFANPYLGSSKVAVR